MEEAKSLRLLGILLARRAAAKKATKGKGQEERTSLESESELSDGSEVDDEQRRINGAALAEIQVQKI
jgi:hypothetical protein